MVTEKGEFEVVALLYGISDRRASHHKPIVFDARQVLQLLKLPDESLLVLFGDIASKPEENYYSD